jgi:hypothetical protein
VASSSSYPSGPAWEYLMNMGTANIIAMQCQ